MALHGNIQVNFNTIGTWEAVNTGPAQDDPDITVYRCKIDYRDIKGYPRQIGPYLVFHNYGDGALALASQVIGRADYLMKVEDTQRARANAQR